MITRRQMMFGASALAVALASQSRLALAAAGEYHVVDYGADPTGATDSTTAIHNCIAAAKAAYPSGAEVIFAPGKYGVSSLNMTGWNSARYRAPGGPGSCVLYGKHQTTAAPILDFTKSSGVIVDNLIVAGQNLDGTVPTVKPLAGVLWGETTAHGNSNKNRMKDCGSIGYFGSAAVCIIGDTDSSQIGCAWQQWDKDRPTLNLSTNPDWAIASLYQTLVTNANPASNVGDHSFFGCEWHGAFVANAACWTHYMRNPDNIRFFGGNNANGAAGLAHLLIQGTAGRKIEYNGIKFYSDSGVAPANLYNLGCPVNGFIDHNNNITDNAFSGARFIGTAPTNLSTLASLRSRASRLDLLARRA